MNLRKLAWVCGGTSAEGERMQLKRDQHAQLATRMAGSLAG
jgi:hypothetical protein